MWCPNTPWTPAAWDPAHCPREPIPRPDHSLIEEPFLNSFTRGRDGGGERRPSHRQAYWMLMDGLPASSRHGGCGVDNELGAWTFSATAVTTLMGALAQWCHSRPAVLVADPPPFGLHLEVKGLWWPSDALLLSLASRTKEKGLVLPSPGIFAGRSYRLACRVAIVCCFWVNGRSVVWVESLPGSPATPLLQSHCTEHRDAEVVPTHLCGRWIHGLLSIP